MADNQPVAPVGERIDVDIDIKDADKTIEFFTKVFGWGPWERREIEREATFNGKPTRYKGIRATLKSGPVIFQIGETHGESFQEEFVKRTGGGLNCLGFVVDDLDATVAKLEKMGMPVIISAKGEDGKYLFVFLDTSKASDGNIHAIELLPH